MCENSKIGTSAAEQFAEKVHNGLVAAGQQSATGDRGATDGVRRGGRRYPSIAHCGISG